MAIIRRCLIVLLSMFSTAALAVTMGDDGLHKTTWMRETFKDLREDLADANAEGKRLMLIIEQRGCIYCAKMHQEIFPLPNIDA
ncbi:MAG: thioredoxin fold domain-containing protein, partial [Sulfitobacter sp.]